jgi:hypothetical protein
MFGSCSDLQKLSADGAIANCPRMGSRKDRKELKRIQVCIPRRSGGSRSPEMPPG